MTHAGKKQANRVASNQTKEDGVSANPKMIFVNLPVTDLQRSRRFLEALGAFNEPKFTDETAACMVFSESIFVMLLTHDKFRQFTPRPIVDSNAASEVLICLSENSRESVDSSVERAVSVGGTADPAPKQDYGVMYGRSVADPDGHIFELMWMDPAAAAQGADALAEATDQAAA
jgi:predicted lactoylglutathione lyase